MSANADGVIRRLSRLHRLKSEDMVMANFRFHVVDLLKRLLMRARETSVGQSLYIQMESQKLPSVVSQQ